MSSGSAHKFETLKNRLPPWIKGRLKRVLGRHGLRFRSQAPSSQIAFDPWTETYSNLEEPCIRISNENFEVRGWLASKREICTVNISGVSGLRLTERSDVSVNYPDYSYVQGFAGTFAAAKSIPSHLKMEAVFKDGTSHNRIFGFELDDDTLSILKESSLRELCSLLLETPPEPKKLPLNFLPDSLRSELKGDFWGATSANEYDELAKGIIGRFKDGKVLDCGAGYRREYFPNVTNLEIFPYPSTDILSTNENLPFKDESFDAVLSLSVLEHVKNPMQSAAEISRVLKKGGTLYASVPFLQPRHGYPHHYYNMTNEGLKNLFAPTLNVEDYGVMTSGLPIWSLRWMLKGWVEGLRGEVKEEFLNMQVKNLLKHPLETLNAPFVKDLSVEKNLELASSTYILANK